MFLKCRSCWKKYIKLKNLNYLKNRSNSEHNAIVVFIVRQNLVKLEDIGLRGPPTIELKNVLL